MISASPQWLSGDGWIPAAISRTTGLDALHLGRSFQRTMKLAILAGATSRIGEAIARRLATESHSRPDRTQRRSARYRAPENLGLGTTDDADVRASLCCHKVGSRTGRDNSLSNGQTIDPGLIIGSRMDRLANIAAFVEPAPFPSPFSAIPMACGGIPESFAAPNAEVLGRASPYRPF